jgi:hypothetical protein
VDNSKHNARLVLRETACGVAWLVFALILIGITTISLIPVLPLITIS